MNLIAIKTLKLFCTQKNTIGHFGLKELLYLVTLNQIHLGLQLSANKNKLEWRDTF